MVPPPIMEAYWDSETMVEFTDCFVVNADLACIDVGTITEISTCISDYIANPPQDIGGFLESGCFDNCSVILRGSIYCCLHKLRSRKR